MSDDSIICFVWYLDGKKEILPYIKFVILVVDDAWRMQLRVIQSFIRPEERRIGKFCRSTIAPLYHMDNSKSTAACDVSTRSINCVAHRKSL